MMQRCCGAALVPGRAALAPSCAALAPAVVTAVSRQRAGGRPGGRCFGSGSSAERLFEQYLFSSKPTSGRCSDVLVKCLAHEKIEWMFGVPGEENLDFVDSLARDKSIRFVVTRHEQGAGFMAATVGRLTGSPAACLSTLGPGATNFSTALAYAYLGGFPMLALTGQKPIRHSKQGAFQIIDVVGHFEEITKFTKVVEEPDLIPSLVRNAVKISREEKPGPVHLELPEDIAAMDTHSPDLHMFPGPYRLPIKRGRRPNADEKAIDHAVRLIHEAKRPILCIAAGCQRARSREMIRQVVEKTGLFAVATQMGKGALSEAHPNYIGCTALSDKDFVHSALSRADLIVNIGHDISEKPPFIMRHNRPPLVIDVNFTRGNADPVYFPHLNVVGDIAHSLWQFRELVTPQAHWDTSVFKRVQAEIKDSLMDSPHTRSAEFPMAVQRLVADLRAAMPADGLVCLDNGMYKIWFARQYPAVASNTLLLDNALATMGAGLPSGIAAKLVFPGRKVCVVTGDGGFMMTCMELETAVRLGLDLVVLILVNNDYGMIKWKQQAAGLQGSELLEFSNPCFARYGEIHGATGHRVQSADHFSEVMQLALAGKGVHVIHCPISYASSNQALFNELPAQVRALDQALDALG